jgi:hypothetical protein
VQSPNNGDPYLWFAGTSSVPKLYLLRMMANIIAKGNRLESELDELKRKYEEQ